MLIVRLNSNSCNLVIFNIFQDFSMSIQNIDSSLIGIVVTGTFDYNMPHQIVMIIIVSHDIFD